MMAKDKGNERQSGTPAQHPKSDEVDFANSKRRYFPLFIRHHSTRMSGDPPSLTGLARGKGRSSSSHPGSIAGVVSFLV